MRRAALALIVLAGCETYTLIDGGTAGGGSSAAGGRAAGGGSTAGGVANAGGSGGAGGGTAGGCSFTCLTGGCQWNPCTGDLCRFDGALGCDGGLCRFASATMSGDQLVSVHGASADDFWVAEGTSRVHHWNGTQWGCLTGHGTNTDLWANERELWIAGQNDPLLWFRFDGGETRFVETQVMEPTLTSLWGDGTGTVWASGNGSVLAFTGPSFRRENLPGGGTPTLQDLRAYADGGTVTVFGVGGTSYWIRDLPDGGWRSENTGAMTPFRGNVMNGNGRVFAATTGGSFHVRSAPTSWMQEGTAPAGVSLNAVGIGPREPWAVGTVVPNDGVLLRRDPSLGWLEAFRHERALNDVWVAPDAGVFIAADSSSVLRYDPPDCPDAIPIADDFSGRTLPGWSRNAGAGQYFTDGGLLWIQANGMAGADATMAAALARDGFVNASLAVEIRQPAQFADGGGNAGLATVLFVNTNSTPSMQTLKVELNNGTLRSFIGDNGTPDASMPVPAFRFVRIREANSRVHFEHTNDPRGLNGWVTFHSAPSPAWLPNVHNVGIGVYNGHARATEPAVFDNLNRCPR